MTASAAQFLAETRSSGLRAQLALARDIYPSSRGQYFRHMFISEGPAPLAFSDVSALPHWLSWSLENRDSLSLATAILYHRPAIERELSGAKLGALADKVGPSIFDHLCNEEFDDTINIGFLSNQLPRPEDLPGIGDRLMYSSLPAAFAQTFPAATGDKEANILVTFAAILIKRLYAEQPAL